MIYLEEINQDPIILAWATTHFSSIQWIADQHDNKHNKQNQDQNQQINTTNQVQGTMTGLHNMNSSSQVGLQNQVTSTSQVSITTVGIQPPTNTAASLAHVSLMNSNTMHKWVQQEQVQ